MGKKKLKRRWLLTGGFGAVLVGAGISCAIESGFFKNDGGPMLQWVLAGTGSLSLIILGVVLLIKAAFIEQRLKK